MYGNIRMLNREDSVLYFPPEAFGPFKVLHQIGAGALGPVFRAHEPAEQHRERLVAVKVFRLDLTPDQTAALVAELDALIQSQLHHANIAAPLAAGVEHGEVYLAQEYAVGDSLDVVLRDHGRLSLDDLVPLVDGLARAIDHAAARGVRHGSLHMRDIVVGNGAARVTGFGIAAAVSKVGAKLPTRPLYSDPDGSSDIYSLAAIAFEAFTGARVSPEAVRELGEQDGTAIRDVFAATLTEDPGLRPTLAVDFARALGEAAGVPLAPLDSEEKPVESAFAPPELPELRRETTPAPDAPTFASLEPEEATVGTTLDHPLDRAIDLGTSRRVVFEPAPMELDAEPGEIVDETPRRRWVVPVMVVLFALTVAAAVGYVLSSSMANPQREAATGVDATTVDLPPGAAPVSPERRPSIQTSPPARSAPPAPTPSRQASGAGRPVATGSLLIRSTPGDAEVVVNGRASGRTPLALRDLALGSYTIQVARDGYTSEQRTLEITSRRPSASTTIELRRAAVPSSVQDATAGVDGVGALNVQTRPSGARVFVNDRLVGGSTPMVISDLPSGPATIRIEMDGYKPWVTTIRVSPERQTRVAASLERTEIQ